MTIYLYMNIYISTYDWSARLQLLILLNTTQPRVQAAEMLINWVNHLQLPY